MSTRTCTDVRAHACLENSITYLKGFSKCLQTQLDTHRGYAPSVAALALCRSLTVVLDVGLW